MSHLARMLPNLSGECGRKYRLSASYVAEHAASRVYPNQHDNEAEALHDESVVSGERPFGWICINDQLIHIHADALGRSPFSFQC